MTIRAFLKKPDKSGLCRIAMVFYSGGKQQWIKTTIKVLPASWDQEGQYIKASQPHSKKLNAKLGEFKVEIANAVEALLKRKVIPTTETVTEYMAPKAVAAESSAISLSSLLFGYEESNTGRLKPGYLRKYGTIGRSLDEHCPGMMADDFNSDELNQYISDYLLDVCEVENNTVHDYVRRIRYVMERAFKRRLINNAECLDFSYKYIQPKRFWLDWEDVEKIEAYEPFLKDQIYKDEFLFRCYTGLRWSDSVNLRPEHFIKNASHVLYDFRVVKTGLSQNIEMNQKAASIIKKWAYRIPKLYQSDCNERIKAIARGAGVADMVEKVKFKGSERIVELLPKWKLVTTHVARRTFARHWMDLGGEIGKLSKYLGHSSIDQTSSYVGYTTSEVNKELRRIMG